MTIFIPKESDFSAYGLSYQLDACSTWLVTTTNIIPTFTLIHVSMSMLQPLLQHPVVTPLLVRPLGTPQQGQDVM